MFLGENVVQIAKVPSSIATNLHFFGFFVGKGGFLSERSLLAGKGKCELGWPLLLRKATRHMC